MLSVRRAPTEQLRGRGKLDAHASPVLCIAQTSSDEGAAAWSGMMQHPWGEEEGEEVGRRCAAMQGELTRILESQCGQAGCRERGG